MTGPKRLLTEISSSLAKSDIHFLETPPAFRIKKHGCARRYDYRHRFAALCLIAILLNHFHNVATAFQMHDRTSSNSLNKRRSHFQGRGEAATATQLDLLGADSKNKIRVWALVGPVLGAWDQLLRSCRSFRNQALLSRPSVTSRQSSKFILGLPMNLATNKLTGLL